MKKSRPLILLLALIAVVGVVSATMLVLWQGPTTTLMVTNESIQAVLVKAAATNIQTGIPSSANYTTWDTIDAHNFQLGVLIFAINNLNTIYLSVNITDVPAYMTFNISKVELWTYPWLVNWQPLVITPIQSNIALGTPIALTSSVIDSQAGSTARQAVVITLLETQTAPTNDLMSIVHATVTLSD